MYTGRQVLLKPHVLAPARTALDRGIIHGSEGWAGPKVDWLFYQGNCSDSEHCTQQYNESTILYLSSNLESRTLS
jgi:hypothetical protein